MNIEIVRYFDLDPDSDDTYIDVVCSFKQINLWMNDYYCVRSHWSEGLEVEKLDYQMSGYLKIIDNRWVLDRELFEIGEGINLES